MLISAKKTGGEAVTVEYDIPEHLHGLTEKFGKDVVYSKAVDSIVIDVQALVRRHLTGTDKVPPKSAAEIQAIVDAYVPGAGAVRKSPVEKAAAALANLSPEDRAAVLKSLKGE